MQKQIARRIALASLIVLGSAIALSQSYPNNKFVAVEIPKIGILAFFTLVGATIAANIRARSDKDDPNRAKLPQLPTPGTAIKKAFMYVIIPGILLTVIFFAVAYAFGWRP